MNWVPLDKARALGAEIIGNKAARLAQLSQAGFAVPKGWVLPVDAVEAGRLEEAAKELRELAPHVSRWMLRSSSPLEDRPGHSAAGLFHSESCSAASLTETLQRVVASRDVELVGELLGVDLPAPLAVLAQPEIKLEHFAMVELRAGREPEVEGEADEALEALLERLAQIASDRAQLAELGRDERGWWLLQLRPAPTEPLPEVAGGLWRRDREHSPRPLCPLLAGVFSDWIAGRDESMSNLICGVWYDRVILRVQPTDAEAEELLALSQNELRSLERIARELQSVAETTSWEEFISRWLGFQGRYFERPLGRLRAWLAGRNPSARGRIASGREQDLQRLQLFGIEREDFLEAHGHHAAWPWDGRGRSWSEEPGQLAEILRHPLKPSPAASDDSLTSRIAEHLEDDDDALARSYAAFRTAARRAALAAGIPEPRWEDVLDLRPSELKSLLTEPGSLDWERAADAGRRRWEQWRRDGVQAAQTGGLVGIPVFAGDVAGRARVLPAATADGGPAEGEVLVVPSIQPADAIVFSRIAGLIVEGGDRLGHAAILARERGVPCIVGVVGACELLSDGPRVRLDTEHGRVERLST